MRSLHNKTINFACSTRWMRKKPRTGYLCRYSEKLGIPYAALDSTQEIDDMDIPEKSTSDINSNHNIILFDGVCKLCNAWCSFVIKYDRNHIFKLTSMQSEEGQLILKHFNLPTENFTSIFYLEKNNIYDKSTAFIKIISLFSYPIKLLSILRYIPLSLRDFIYNIIARNRYNIFGRYENCILPAADYPDRYIKKTDIDNKEWN